MIVAPTAIHCPRLQLRRERLSDIDGIFAYASDPEVARYMDWPRATEVAEIEAYLEEAQRAWLTGEEFFWAVTLKANRELIGGASLRVKHADAEFGYVLNRKYWRQGFGTEVATALIQTGFSMPVVRRVWATCDVENYASARVLEKCGLRQEAVLYAHMVRPNISAKRRDALLFSLAR